MIQASRIFSILLIFVFFSCKKQLETSEQLAVVVDTTNQKSITVQFHKLTPEAETYLKDAPEFLPFKRGLDSLNQISVETATELLNRLNDRTLDFEELLPKNLKSNPVTARVKVLVTEVGVLEQKANKGKLTVKELNSSKKAIANAYNNFVDQVNELYLKIPENIAKELLQESKNLSDSIPSP